jgi:hypothetical protein
MSPVFKFAAVFALGIVGMSLAPRHACRLSSAPLFGLVVVGCLVAIPLSAARTKKALVAWTIGVAAPFIAFAAVLFYIEVLHWDRFPKWLLHDGTPNKPAAGNAGIAPQLAIGYYWPGVPEPGR